MKKPFSLFKASIEFGGTINSDLVGMVKYNLNGLKVRLKFGIYRCIEIDHDPSDLCILPNGNILTTNHANERLSLYDEDFLFIKHIEKINGLILRPLSFE